MSRLAITFLLLFVAAHCVLADLVPDPAAKAVGAVDSETYSLYQRLAGSTWNYKVNGKTYDLGFGAGGTVSLEYWPGATWRITGPSSIAIKNVKDGEMPVRFNLDFKRFVAKDYSGSDAIGTRRNPNAKIDR